MTARQRILIVDDETKVAFFLQESLEALDHDLEVVSVSSTEAALRQITAQSFDLLVVDQWMPGMDGLALVAQVRERQPDTLFILITAYGSESVLAKARLLGAYRCFTKPFHIEDFVQTVLEALQKTDGWSGNSLLDQHVDVLGDRLEELRREVGAQCVLASTSAGALVAQAGVLAGLDVEQLLQLAAESFTTSLAMVHYLGGNHSSNLNYHEGVRHDIYTANVHEDLFLAIVFDRRVQASRIGIVWLYARRAIENLRRLLALSLTDEAGAGRPKTAARDSSPFHGELVSINQVVT